MWAVLKNVRMIFSRDPRNQLDGQQQSKWIIWQIARDSQSAKKCATNFPSSRPVQGSNTIRIQIPSLRTTKEMMRKILSDNIPSSLDDNVLVNARYPADEYADGK